MGWWQVAHVILVSAQVQIFGFWGFSDLVRLLIIGSGLGDCWDGGLRLGLGHDKNFNLRLRTNVLVN